ncbi:phage major capsid protein [Neomegalonema perideroedes]|uniref:phage major capsid protein n=1 Tax=Neomegalonema perideroedes TaxID=217219 RepID=UPI0003813DA9|nr:phage major capsid protein [Neomegalonema perideroedes]
MADVNDLRRNRAEASARMSAEADALEALENAETPDQTAISAAQSRFDAARADFNKLDNQVTRAEETESARAASAREVAPAPRRPADASRPEDLGMEAGLYVLSLAAVGGDTEKAARYAERKLGASRVANELTAALNTGEPEAGGVLVPEVYSAELIRLLSARAVVRQAGARVIDMPAGNIRRARQIAAPTASYGAEGSAILVSEPEFDKVDLSFKRLSGMIPLTNNLIRQGSPSVAAFVRDTLVHHMSLREDLAFIRDDGTGDAPKGLRYWAKSAHVYAANATTNAGTVARDIRKAVALVEDSGVSMTRPGWFMRPSTRAYLAELTNASGAKLYPEIDSSNTLLGYPIHKAAHIPGNLGGGTHTEIYFADFWEIVIGDSLSLALDMSDQAGYVDGSGDYVSAFQRDLTLVRAISEHDLAPDHVEAISVITGVGWSLAA